MNQVANRRANQPIFQWLMIKQQIKDWNGMLRFLISFCQNEESIAYIAKAGCRASKQIAISITQITSDTSYKFEAVNNLDSPHDTTRVTNKRVTFSDEQDNEIQSESAMSNSQPNEWQMPDKINLDSSGLRRSAHSAVLSWQEKVYSHSTTVLKSV